MNKIKFFVFKIIFTLILFTGSSYAKNIPPGSGIGDVPANILILLDKSGSMSVRMTSGSGFMYPYSSAADSSGNVYVGQYHIYGIKKFTYSTAAVDTSFASSGTYKWLAVSPPHLCTTRPKSELVDWQKHENGGG